MNQLTERTFGDHRIRIVTIADQPWFVAADVCRALGFAEHPSGGYQNQLRRLADAEKQTLSRSTLSGSGLPNRAAYVSEPGLYKLILRSDKPEAKRFQDWVTRDVLPAIRKDGGYILGEERVATGEMSEDELVAKAMQVMARKIERLQSDNAVMSAELNLLTVDEYRALSHAYWPRGYGSKVGVRAKAICSQRGIAVTTQKRKFRTYAGVRTTEVGVYPRAILDEAVTIIGRPRLAQF